MKILFVSVLLVCLSPLASAEQIRCASEIFKNSLSEQRSLVERIQQTERDIQVLRSQINQREVPDLSEFRKTDTRYEWMTEQELTRVYLISQRKKANALIHSVFDLRARLLAFVLKADDRFREELKRIQYHFHLEYTDLPTDYRPERVLTYQHAYLYKELFDASSVEVGKDGVNRALPGNLTTEQAASWVKHLKESGFDRFQPWHTVQMIVRGTPSRSPKQLGFRERCCLGACTQCPWSTEEFAQAKDRKQNEIKP